MRGKVLQNWLSFEERYVLFERKFQVFRLHTYMSGCQVDMWSADYLQC